MTPQEYDAMVKAGYAADDAEQYKTMVGFSAFLLVFAAVVAMVI